MMLLGILDECAQEGIHPLLDHRLLLVHALYREEGVQSTLAECLRFVVQSGKIVATYRGKSSQ